jgi:hypothetical protein
LNVPGGGESITSDKPACWANQSSTSFHGWKRKLNRSFTSAEGIGLGLELLAGDAGSVFDAAAGGSGLVGGRADSGRSGGARSGLILGDADSDGGGPGSRLTGGGSVSGLTGGSALTGLAVGSGLAVAAWEADAASAAAGFGPGCAANEAGCMENAQARATKVTPAKRSDFGDRIENMFPLTRRTGRRRARPADARCAYI